MIASQVRTRTIATSQHNKEMEGDPWACAESGDVETMKQMLRRSDVSEWINKIGNNHVRKTLKSNMINGQCFYWGLSCVVIIEDAMV